MFGGGSSVKALEWLQQYKRLQQKKKSASLSDAENQMLTELERKLSKIANPQATTQTLNRRQGLRVNATISAQFSTSDELKKAFIKNISGGGLFIESDHLLQMNQEFPLHLFLPQSKEALVVQVIVVWIQSKPTRELPRGMGVKFVKLTDEQRQKIEALIEQKLTEAVKGV